MSLLICMLVISLIVNVTASPRHKRQIIDTAAIDTMPLAGDAAVVVEDTVVEDPPVIPAYGMIQQPLRITMQFLFAKNKFYTYNGYFKFEMKYGKTVLNGKENELVTNKHFSSAALCQFCVSSTSALLHTLVGGSVHKEKSLIGLLIVARFALFTLARRAKFHVRYLSTSTNCNFQDGKLLFFNIVVHSRPTPCRFMLFNKTATDSSDQACSTFAMARTGQFPAIACACQSVSSTNLDATIKDRRFFSGTFLSSSDTMEKSSKSSSTPSAGRRSRQRRTAEKKNSVGGSVGQLSLLASTADGRKRKSKAGTQLKNLLAPTYKTRCEEFRRVFKEPAENEKLVIDYSCAYQKEILLHGRMYLSQNWLCFYSNIFKWETQVTIRYKDIVAVTKERTAKIIPNAIYVVTNTNEKLFFTSFSARDKTFMMLFRLWQYALLDQVVYPGDMWSWAQHGYDEADLSESEVEEEAAVAYEELGATYGAEMVDSNVGVEIASSEQIRFRNCRQKGSGSTIRSQPPPPSSHLSLTNKPASSSSSSSSNSSGRNGGPGLAPKGTKDRLHGKCRSLVDFHGLTMAAAVPDSSSPAPARFTSNDLSENDNDDLDDDDDEEEACCPCTTHRGRELLNTVCPLSVDQLFLWLFTDSEFFRQLHHVRKSKNMILSDWKIDRTTKAKLRQISYSVAVNHALAPKSCEVVEKQECTEVSRAGKVYVIKVEVQNFGIPYSDAFQVDLTYCLTKVAENQCRLRVNAQVVYRKSCWGIVKRKLLKLECHRLGLTSALPSDHSVESNSENKLHILSEEVEAQDQESEKSSRAKLEHYAVIIIALLCILILLCLWMLFRQRTEYAETFHEQQRAECSFEKMISEFRHLVMQESLILQTIVNSSSVQQQLLRNLHQWNEALQLAVSMLQSAKLTNAENIISSLTVDKFNATTLFTRFTSLWRRVPKG
ncbi:GRAM domain-containing protein 1B [Trichinella spiralis]|uniref:GRAM domain-containing protein 1B n=1 Tax=Trichinella spiralis TaxID=6334 RepID=A0A0V1BLU4_TRISP|nr:GRAM domain-containing protein 1B [Trichinella spiralis]